MNCQEAVTLKAKESKRVTPYFSHLPGSAHLERRGCSKESIIHLAAKLKLVEVLQNGEEVQLEMQCSGWTWEEKPVVCPEQRREPLPATFNMVQSEYTHGRHRFDVALLENDAPVFAFEVFYAHAVTNNKAEAITLPFVELDAHAVLESPLLLRPLRDNLDKWQCPACQEAEAREHQRLEALRARRQAQQTLKDTPKRQPIPLYPSREQPQRAPADPRFALNLPANKRLSTARAWLSQHCGDVDQLPLLSFTLATCTSCSETMVLFILLHYGQDLERYCQGYTFPATLKVPSHAHAESQPVNVCQVCFREQPPVRLGWGQIVFAANIKALKTTASYPLV